MESRFRVLFLILMAQFALSGCAATKNLFGFGRDEAPPPTAESPGQVIDPEVERREIKEPKIDKENFEIGAFAGIMSIEDFGTDLAYGARLAYHLTEGFFVEGTVGQTEAGLTSFESLSGGARLFEDRAHRVGVLEPVGLLGLELAKSLEGDAVEVGGAAAAAVSPAADEADSEPSGAVSV